VRRLAAGDAVQSCAIGRPEWRLVVSRLARQAPGAALAVFARRHRDHVHLRVAPFPERRAAAERHALYHSRIDALLLVFLVGLGLLLLLQAGRRQGFALRLGLPLIRAQRRKKSDDLPIGRPGRGRRAVQHVRELHGLAAIRRDDVDLRLAAACGDKSQGLAVRTPARGGIGRLAAGELAQPAPTGRHQPDRLARLVLVAVADQPDEGDLPPIRADLRVLHAHHAVKILYLNQTFFLRHSHSSCCASAPNRICTSSASL